LHSIDGMLTTASGPVSPEAFLSFVRRAARDRWVETGRMKRSDRNGGPGLPPQSELDDAHGQRPAAPPPAASAPAAPLDPQTNVAIPRSGR
jgi:hypothetical protein